MLVDGRNRILEGQKRIWNTQEKGVVKKRLTFDTVNAGDHWDLTKKVRCYWNFKSDIQILN